MRCYSGRVAQLVEQVTFNHWVTGSNPVALTIAPASASAFPPGIIRQEYDAPGRNMRPGALCRAGFKEEKALYRYTNSFFIERHHNSKSVFV